MRHPLVLLSLCALLLPLALPAQTSYFGIPDNNAASGGGNVIPFGNGSSGTWENQRYQSLALQKFLPAKPGLLQSIAFSPTGSGTYQFKAMIVRIGHNTSGAMGPSWNNSFSTPPATVINQVNYNWLVTQDTWSPMPFSSPKPFIYNGKDNLVIEVVALGSNMNSKASFHRETELRAYKVGFTLNGRVATYGNGCPGSNNKEPVFADYSYPLIGADHFQMGLADAAPNTSAFFILGTSKTAFGPVALPFDLGFLGASKCFLNSNIVLLLPGVTTSAAGEARINLAIPADPGLEGGMVYGQWLVADPKANAAGLVTSRGMELILTEMNLTPSSTTSAAALRVQLGFI